MLSKISSIQIFVIEKIVFVARVKLATSFLRVLAKKSIN